MSTNNQKITFGTDPEFAVVYEKNGKTFVLPPVFFRLGLGVPVTVNPKEPAHPVFRDYGTSKIHEDGVAFEMSIQPSEDWRALWTNVRESADRFDADFLAPYGEYCIPKLQSLPTTDYEADRWLEAGEDYYFCNVFGCDRDYDVYNTKAGAKVIRAELHPERYFGGHVHFSGIPEIEKSPHLAIRSLVMTAGLASCAFSDVPDLDRRRLHLYGKPGKFRPQKYPDGAVGIEYRTMSTRWTDNFPLAEKIFTWAEIGINALLVGGLFEKVATRFENDAKTAILEFDQETAKAILHELEGVV